MGYVGSDEISPFMVVGGYEEYQGIPNWFWVIVIIILSWVIWTYMNKSSPGVWQTSDWKDCSAVCGNGTQSRDVTCSNDNCDPLTKPNTSQPCGEVPCWSKTDLVGGTGGVAYDYKCPDGQYVDKIYYRAGSGVDQLGVRCSGSAVDEATSNLYGGLGGSPGTFDLINGVDSFYVTGDNYVGNITPGTATEANFLQGGTASGVWSGTTKKLSCSRGSKISGIYGKSGSAIDALGFNCYKTS